MNSTVYVVIYSRGELRTGDPYSVHCAGVFSTIEQANIAKRAVGGTIITKVIDHLEPGYIAHAKALGFDV